MTKDEELEQLRQENSALRDQVALLSERIRVLEAKLAKDSHNSHLPPSSDRFQRQPKSLRKKSGKQPGGQAGHAGTTLELSETPNLVIVHPVEHCQHCQRDLREVESLHVERRRVLEMHVSKTEHLTHYAVHRKRGKEALDAIGILKDFQGVSVHDGWRSYWQYVCQHGLCNVHHLRELTFLEEERQQAWAAEMKELLLDSKAAVAQARAEGRWRWPTGKPAMAPCWPKAIKPTRLIRHQRQARKADANSRQLAICSIACLSTRKPCCCSWTTSRCHSTTF
jgi:hypothetical protein